jgi:hypothetical protein
MVQELCERFPSGLEQASALRALLEITRPFDFVVIPQRVQRELLQQVRKIVDVVALGGTTLRIPLPTGAAALKHAKP